MVKPMVVAWALLFVFVVYVAPTHAQRPGNAILIEDAGWNPEQPEHRPFTISRVFDRGEFLECVQAGSGTDLFETQCDVKARWADGSVRHALLTFWADLPYTKYKQIDFYPQSCLQPGGYMGKEDLLNALDGQWGAVIVTRANVPRGEQETQSASVRAILAAWDGHESDTGVRYWLKGPLVTQVIVEDKGAGTPFDFGWRGELQPVIADTAIGVKDSKIKVRASSAANLAGWTFPMIAYIGTERIKICSATSEELSVCGRELDGTKARPLPSAQPVTPDAGWRKAEEEQFKSLHPVFVVTAYRNWPGVKVEAILENMWSTRLQDQAYRARVMKGLNGDQPVWEGEVVHVAQTRWRKTFWQGTALPPLRIDHNFPYLMYTGAVPSYDLAAQPSGAAKKAMQEMCARSDQGDVNGAGTWNVRMPDTGGRPDLGLMPRWSLMALYTSDPTLQRCMFFNAEVSGHIPMHLRESRVSEKPFAAGGEETSVGRAASLDVRPTMMAQRRYFAARESKDEDRIVPVGAISGGPWVVDRAHAPSPAYVPYILSGDWYYLEEVQLWAGYLLAMSTTGTCSWCRGSDSMGYMYGGSELRSEAWGMRSLAEAAFISPTGSPESRYFNQKLMNNIAVREGVFDIRDGRFHEPAPDCAAPCTETRWRFGRDISAGGRQNPLRFPESGGTDLVDASVMDPAQVQMAGSPWQQHLMHMSLGWIEDMGYEEVKPLRQALMANLIEQLQHPDYNPTLAAAYRVPIRRKPDGLFFDSWAAVRSAFNEPLRSEMRFADSRLGSGFGYPYMMAGASSFGYGQKTASGFDGIRAWLWARSSVRLEIYREDPTWALTPHPRRMSSDEQAAALRRQAPGWYKAPKKPAKLMQVVAQGTEAQPALD